MVITEYTLWGGGGGPLWVTQFCFCFCVYLRVYVEGSRAGRRGCWYEFVHCVLGEIYVCILLNYHLLELTRFIIAIEVDFQTSDAL